MTERSINVITTFDGTQIPIPKEGDIQEINGKKHVWKSRGDDQCSIYEWVEHIEYHEDDFYGAYF